MALHARRSCRKRIYGLFYPISVLDKERILEVRKNCSLESVMDNPNFRFVKADICDHGEVEKIFEEEFLI